jgi:hypothetical protein
MDEAISTQYQIHMIELPDLLKRKLHPRSCIV